MRLNRTRICAWILSLAMVAASATGAGVPSYTAQAAGGDIKTYSFGSGGAVTKASVYDPAIGFGFTDVSYPNESAGWVNNVYRPREKAEATGASNVTNGTDYLTIASKVWTETGVPLGTDKSTQGTFRYDDTSAFNVDLSPVDYNVSVTLANPTDKPIDVQLIAEDLVKAIVTVPAGSASTPVPSFLISLIDNQLNLKFEAVSTATALDEAVPQNVYVKSVAIEEKETESKGVKPTVYIASDSTVQTYDANFYPQTGWGQVLYKYFAGADEMVESSTAADYGQSRKYDMPSCTIENRAIGGRSSKSFIDEGKLDSILNSIRPGDYMLVQWGHNDATYARPNRYVSSADFSKYIQKYIDGCRERSATCILVTPVPRYVFQNGKCQISFPEYRQVMLDLAAAQKIPVLDLGKAGADFLTGFGETESRSVFMQLDPGEYPNYPNGQSDATHYQEFGAAKMAKILAQLIKKNDQLQSLAALVPEITVPVKVPDQPKSLTAVTVGSSSVKIQWGAVTGADLYNIYRAESTAGQTADPADFKKCGTSVTAQYTDKNCQGGYTYAYKVSAVNDKGESEKSETLSATTKDSLYKYDFTGSGTNKKDAVGPTMQGWNQVKDNQMYSQKDGYGFLTAPLDGRTRSIEGVNDMECDFCLSDHDYEFAVDLPNGTYSVKTYAGDPIGSSIKTTVTAEGKALYTVVSPKKGVGSKEAEATVTDGQLNLVISGNRYLNGIEITPLSVAPSGLDCYELDLTKSTQEAYFSLRFNPSPDAVSYRIYHKLSTDAKYTLLDSFDTDHFDDLHSYHEKKGGIYNYYAVGVLADGTESGSSNVISVNMMDSDATPPLAPTGLVCDSAKNGEIKIHWNASAGATGYVVYRSAKPGTDFQKIAALEGIATSYTDTDADLTTNIHYYYKVQANGAGGAGQLSAALETPITGALTRQAAETLTDRALIAVDLGKSSGDGGTAKNGSGVYLSWRLFKEDPKGITFGVYRNRTLVKSKLTVTNWTDPDGKAGDEYYVVASSGVGSDASHPYKVTAKSHQYIELQLVKPADETMPDGTVTSYTANDMSVADLDNDGKYELVVKWMPSNAQDNSKPGFTGTTILDAYDFNSDGSATLMWRIDLGINIRSGAHYTQFQVYDMDGDGIAEVACKTADGSTAYSYDNVAGKFTETGHVGAVSAKNIPTGKRSPQYDYRNDSGYILTGAEYLTVFNGKTGEIIDTTDYLPPRGDVSSWGNNEGYGNRVDRFLSVTAYLDGVHPSFVFCRGYYGKSCLTAYDYVNHKLKVRWKFTTEDYKNNPTAVEAQGNHSANAIDIDGDGKDEIVYGSLVVDHDGTLKYSTGLGHGDAIHVGDWIPSRPGLEIFQVHEHLDAKYNVEIHDAETGEILWGYHTGKDTGRGVAADIDPTYPGAELWSSVEWDGKNGGFYSSLSTFEKPVQISQNTPSVNFTIYWDGDLLKEMFDHTFNASNGNYYPVSTNITKWNYETKQEEKLFESSEVFTNNGTKGNPGLAADIMGDWRDELILRCSADNSKIRIYTTTIPTKYSIPTLMQNSSYRLAVSNQNVGYNQPSDLDYSLTDGLAAAKVEATALNARAVSVKWTPASDGVYGHPVEGYAVFRAGEDGKYSLITTLKADGRMKDAALNNISGIDKSGKYFYTDDAVSPQSFYSYEVAAIVDGEPSFHSIPAAVQTGTDKTLGQLVGSVPVTPVTQVSPVTFVSDTHSSLSVNNAYTFKITSKDGKAPIFIVGTPGIFTVQLVKQSGSDYYIKIIAVGAPGTQAGIYINGGSRYLVATVGSNPSYVKSDTRGSFRVKAGKSYVFKLTGNAKPSFVAGTGSTFRVNFVKQSGKDYFFRVTAVGKAGQASGFYINHQARAAIATISQ